MSKVDDPIEAKVLEIIGKIARTKKPITGNTSINHDLPIDGDDAAEQIDAIWAEFNTKFEGFNFDQYFNGEGDLTFFSFKRKRKKNLSVKHLVDVVRQGSWFEHA